MRMNPASTTRSGENASTAAAKADSKPCASLAWSTTLTGTPRSEARESPAASERLLMTLTTWPAIVPARSASTIAAMFDPRPEMRITSRFIVRALSGPGSCDDGRRSARSTAFDAADRERGFTLRAQARDRRLGVAGGNHQDHADAAVEYPVHFRRRDVTGALQPVENRRYRPARGVDARDEPWRQHPVRVFGQPAAGDVRHAFDFHLAQEREHRLDIDARRLEQHFAQRA